jgi:hypothetical protein
LALVFSCHLDAEAEDARIALKNARDLSPLTEYIEKRLSLTPLETLAKACLDLDVSTATVRNIFDNYDCFLAILDDPDKRGELAAARTHEELRKSRVWEQVRDVSQPFHKALVALFLSENDKLTTLSMSYGLF